MKHQWKYYIDIVPGESIEQETACERCGMVLTDDNEHDDNCGEDYFE